MTKKRHKFFETRWFGLVIGLFIAVIFIVIDLGTEIFNNLERKSTDLNFFLKNINVAQSNQEGVQTLQRNTSISEDIVIIGIDNKTLSRYGRWPFDRAVHADFINSLSRISDQSEREKSVLFDVFIVEPQSEAQNDALLVRSMADSGSVFMETIFDKNVMDFESHQNMLARNSILEERFGSFLDVQGEWEDVLAYEGLQAPLKPYSQVIAGVGHANYQSDHDDIYRRQALILKFSHETEQIPLEEINTDIFIDSKNYERLAWMDKEGNINNISLPLTVKELQDVKEQIITQAPPVLEINDDGSIGKEYYIVRKYRDTFIPAISLSLAMDYFHVDISNVSVILGDSVILRNPKQIDPITNTLSPVANEIKIPIDEQGQMLINYMGVRSSAAIDGHQTFPVRSFANYADRVPGTDPSTWPRTKALKGKILMVGAFSDGMAQDEKPTPFGLMYGIEIHANALNTILMQNFLTHIPEWLDYLLFFILVLLISFMCSRLSTIWSFITFLVSILIIFMFSTFVFDIKNIIYDFPKVVIAMGLSLVAILAYRAMTEEKDKRQIRETFGKYVSPQVVDQLVENPPELGGVDKDISVLFSDIRGFTTLSENMTPQELVNHLNIYLTAMTDIIHEYFGTLDKYVGDEIMCFWGAPLPQENHAIFACKCALRQMEALHQLNEQWPAHKRINIGIGINSGIMTVGNMGSPGRMNYTLMGDNVNLGARLEGTNKQYGTNVIISEFTYALVKDYFIVRELDNIRVKGKNKPVLMYELVDVIDQPDIIPSREINLNGKE